MQITIEVTDLLWLQLKQLEDCLPEALDRITSTRSASSTLTKVIIRAEAHEVRFPMAVTTEFRQKAIELLENLPGESLIKAVEYLETLAHTALPAAVAPELELNEATLVEIIQSRLSSEEQARLDYLRQRNETGIITDTEHEEL
jgi:hypothetical protein